jgi:chromosome segregation ATPase
MRKRISAEVMTAIVHNYIYGGTQDEIARQFVISHGSVNNFIKDLLDGKIPAFKDIRDYVSEAHKLSVLMKREGTEIYDLMLGAEILRRFHELKVNFRDIDKNIRALRNSASNDFEAAEILKVMIKIDALEKEHNIDFANLPERLRTLAMENKKKENRLSEFIRKVAEEEERLRDLNKEKEKIQKYNNEWKNKITDLQANLEKCTKEKEAANNEIVKQNAQLWKAEIKMKGQVDKKLFNEQIVVINKLTSILKDMNLENLMLELKSAIEGLRAAELITPLSKELQNTLNHLLASERVLTSSQNRYRSLFGVIWE